MNQQFKPVPSSARKRISKEIRISTDVLRNGEYLRELETAELEELQEKLVELRNDFLTKVSKRLAAKAEKLAKDAEENKSLQEGLNTDLKN
jgi:ClpP class serine protease